MGFSWAGASEALNENLERIREKEIREEEIALQRENALFQLGLTKTKDRAKYQNSERYTKATEDTLKLQAQLDSLDLDEETLKFYQPVLEDPFAASDVLDFIDKAKEDGLNISYSMLPSLMQVVESSAPEETKIDYVSMITGADLSNKEEYYKLAEKINAMTSSPGRTALVVPSADFGVDTTKQMEKYETQFDLAVNSLLPLAREKLMSLPDISVEKNRLMAAITGVETGSGAGLSTAQNTLMDMLFNPNTFKIMAERNPNIFFDYKNNPLLNPYLQAEEAVPSPTGTVLTQEDIDSSPNLQSLNAQPGDKIINGVLHDANGNPKQ